MAFIKIESQPQRWTHFSYFASGGADGVITESVNPGVEFKIEEVRMHFSAKFASVADFTLRLSADQGSAHNAVLFSQAMSDLYDFVWRPSIPMYFLSGDQVVANVPVGSGTNIIGLNIQGWAVRG